MSGESLESTKELLREAIGKHQALPLDVQQLGAVAEIMATCIGMAVQDNDHLRQDNERLMGEVGAWRKEVEGSASGATFVTIKNLNLEISSWKRCAKENAILADDRLAALHARDKALVEAREALERCDCSCDHKPPKYKCLRCKSLATLNSLLGDKCGVATPPPDNQKGGS